MYMYYFLGQQLMNNPHFSAADKEKAARNTYLLALDGDVDFKPEAVLLLVDMMKKNDRVGAACGRIHPIGRGIVTLCVVYTCFHLPTSTSVNALIMG
ncbi:hypothetical protein EB796_003100 [Bugula neritina]|uniref:chitin synthase n=1 Tax=Bugula neritina TaxID=10212 RepID=A0A7J7KIR3_BUGNE|nr:hypothetical protein EB796_003100 [Bugula neritina]